MIKIEDLKPRQRVLYNGIECVVMKIDLPNQSFPFIPSKHTITLYYNPGIITCSIEDISLI